MTHTSTNKWECEWVVAVDWLRLGTDKLLFSAHLRRKEHMWRQKRANLLRTDFKCANPDLRICAFKIALPHSELVCSTNQHNYSFLIVCPTISVTVPINVFRIRWKPLLISIWNPIALPTMWPLWPGFDLPTRSPTIKQNELYQQQCMWTHPIWPVWTHPICPSTHVHMHMCAICRSAVESIRLLTLLIPQ